MRVVFALLLPLLSACVTTKLASGADAVRVTDNADVVKSCQYIGEAKASDRMNGGLLGMDAAEENTYRRLKNRVVEMGGDTVHIQRASTTQAGASLRGEAYKCL